MVRDFLVNVIFEHIISLITFMYLRKAKKTEPLMTVDAVALPIVDPVQISLPMQYHLSS